jgi:hypothetical protein
MTPSYRIAQSEVRKLDAQMTAICSQTEAGANQTFSTMHFPLGSTTQKGCKALKT